MTEAVRITLNEWEERLPDSESPLRNVFLPDDGSGRGTADALSLARMLEFEELRQGIRLRSRSFVGRVTIGPLEVTIQPKISGFPLMALLRYAFGLRNLHLTTATRFDTATSVFQDLLVAQLVAETRELHSRGLLRQYVARHEWLSSPRGRIDLQAIAGSAAVQTRLPCRQYSRLVDWLPNQMLLSGLQLGARMAVDQRVKSQARQLASLFADDMSYRELDRMAFSEWSRIQSRQTRPYNPAIQVVRLLAEGHGIVLEGEVGLPRMRGFLFDMNRLFQAFLSRFLQENLAGFEVRDEQRLNQMMAYAPEKNPQNRKDPAPRPDFAILKNGVVIRLLDAKYRDLWERNLPRDMLYQLAIYALSQPQCRDAVILYPTTDPAAEEAVIDVRDPLRAGKTASVIQRPVRLDLVADVLRETGPHAVDRRAEMARQWVGI